MLKTKTDVQRFAIPIGEDEERNRFQQRIDRALLRRSSESIWCHNKKLALSLNIAGAYDITLGTDPTYSLADARKWHQRQAQNTKQGFIPGKWEAHYDE